MTVTTLARPELGQLEMYRRDDLELFILDTGAVFASQSAIARMLGMQQGHLSSVLKRPILAEDKVKEIGYTLKLESANGVREQTLYGVSTICKLASRYNQQFAIKMAEMGATLYLYKLAGYRAEMVDIAMPETALPKSSNASYAQHLQTAYEALGKMANLHSFAEDKPGLQAYLELAETSPKHTLSGMMTIDQMAEQVGATLTSEQSRQIGRSMAGVARSQEADAPSFTRKRYKDASGNYQSYDVKEYSTGYLPLFRALCQAYGIFMGKG